MAYLEDIPKYAFGTTHEIDWASRTSTSSGSSSSSSSPSAESGPSSSNHASSSHSSSVAGGSGTSAGGSSSHATSRDHSSSRVSPSKISETKFRELILHAVRLGCRHFDCAPLYKTQPLVGAALREAMNTVPRQKLFITSKLPPNMMRRENILRSITKSIEELQCNYLDLFLIHSPFSTKHISDENIYPLDEEGNLLLDEEEQLLENAWRELVDLKRKGLTRYIGVSNVNLEQLIRLNNIHHIDVVQNEYHIYNQNREILDYCEEIDVHFEAYAAMGNPDKARRDNKPCAALDPIVQRVARVNRLSIAEVNIQWVYQQPLSYVIRCDTPRQLEENLRATKCISLPVNDLIDLDTLNRDVRLYLFDEHKGIVRHREYPFKKHIRDPNKEPLGECKQQIEHHQARHHKQRYNLNNNNESDLSSSDCSDLSGEKVSLVSNLKNSSSQSDSSITTTIARTTLASSTTKPGSKSGTDNDMTDPDQPDRV